jgi:hypothetical protein
MIAYHRVCHSPHQHLLQQRWHLIQVCWPSLPLEHAKSAMHALLQPWRICLLG